MIDGENLVAEKDVTIQERHAVKVRISHHEEEGFWRVEVTSAAHRGGSTNATVADGESFLMYLIDEALRDNNAAWDHLARWGNNVHGRPALGLRPAV